MTRLLPARRQAPGATEGDASRARKHAPWSVREGFVECSSTTSRARSSATLVPGDTDGARAGNLPDFVVRVSPSQVAIMSPGSLVFHPFRLDIDNQEFWRGDHAIALRPKTFAFLLYLARHPRRLVTKRELLTNLWADVSVNDDLLRSYIREIRAALGDDARTPRYLATVARRGYKFDSSGFRVGLIRGVAEGRRSGRERRRGSCRSYGSRRRAS
jgi:DNA-binding winged helix-turn-helix (wHTH) protein